LTQFRLWPAILDAGLYGGFSDLWANRKSLLLSSCPSRDGGFRAYLSGRPTRLDVTRWFMFESSNGTNNGTGSIGDRRDRRETEMAAKKSGFAFDLPSFKILPSTREPDPAGF
jgi:hypothetical protein